MSRWGFRFTLWCVLLVACGAPAAESAPNTLTAAEREAGWELLFDGETTDRWRGYGMDSFPAHGWNVRDGMLVVGDSGETRGGDIVTRDEFGDFDLILDFRLTPVANSGIFYRVIDREGEPIWGNAPEFQLLDDSAYVAMGTMDMHTHLTGDNYDLHPSRVAASNPVGEWNQARIVVDDGRVEHWLNGQLTVAYELSTPEWDTLVAQSKFAEYPDYGRSSSGPIGLQDHDHLVYFRNIKIRRR